jgi:hypothetical protein
VLSRLVGSNPTPAAKLDGEDVGVADITPDAFSMEREQSMPFASALRDDHPRQLTRRRRVCDGARGA